MAATRQGKRHVGAYVDPDVARRLRVIAAQEDTSTQALIMRRHRAGVSGAVRLGFALPFCDHQLCRHGQHARDKPSVSRVPIITPRKRQNGGAIPEHEYHPPPVSVDLNQRTFKRTRQTLTYQHRDQPRPVRRMVSPVPAFSSLNRSRSYWRSE